jgi:2-polyprenyl-3-methyl-5-hydroxy-6-metoxy-1,4-benzoquinol methylase
MGSRPVAVERTTSRSAWRLLSAHENEMQRGAEAAYYDRVRGELLDMIEIAPHTVLDVGCGGGATDAELKRRFPAASVVGIEAVAAAAQRAQTRLDRVIAANAEVLDFSAAGLEPGAFDLIIVADVLEHMYDPWHMLERLRPLVAPGGRILASIPNVRNLWLLEKIVRGHFDYRDEGLLDITHIRFFTLAEMRTMFADTGYAIERTRLNIDGNLPERVPYKRLPSPRAFAHFWHALRTLRDRDHGHVLVSRERGSTYRVDTARLVLTGLSRADLDELFCSQIYLVAYVSGTH